MTKFRKVGAKLDDKKEIIYFLAKNKGLTVDQIIDLTPAQMAENMDKDILEEVKRYTNKNHDLLKKHNLFFASNKGKDHKMTAQSLRMTMKKYLDEIGMHQDKALFTGRTAAPKEPDFIPAEADVDSVADLLKSLG